MPLVEFSTDNKEKFLVEVPAEPGLRRAARPNEIQRAAHGFEQALETVRPVTSAIYQKLQDTTTPADEVEVKFGIKLTANAEAIIACFGSQVNFEISMKWQKPPRKID